jgi:hypothetical protein
MKIKKFVFVYILTVLCLVVVFSTVTINAAYDPNDDVNHDGAINMKDIALVARAFGSSGDPTMPVNVTNPLATTITEDLNISTYFGNTGNGGFNSTNPFSTQGYDRMFVSAAIVDISNNSQGITFVNLDTVSWIWGPINGTTVQTYDYNFQNQLNITMYGPSSMPVPSMQSAELTVKAPQCSLGFSANPWFGNGWVFVRVFIYLTFGTASPPSTQDTYVTNNVQAQPSSATQSYYFNTSINGGFGSNSTYVNIGGYSRMFVSITIYGASYQGVPVTTTVYLGSISWDYNDGSFETVPSGVLNATYYGSTLPAYSQQTPPQFTTKNSYCYLNFYVSSGATSGWIAFSINVYLRNE